MEFGKVTPEELEQIDFTLPPDPAVNSEVLQPFEGNTKFYIGCAKWGRPDWVGKLYPKKTKPKDFLEHYARIFNCIEFNAVYYRMPFPSDVWQWKSKVPENFLFCPKFTDVITHKKRLKNAEFETGKFLEAIVEFKDNLGPIFLMPHPQMSPKQIDTLFNFIDTFPDDIDMFVELRHPDWYKGGYHTELYNFLREQQRGTIITDATGRRDCVHMHLTTPECFIRFVGNSLHPTDYTRIDEWVQRIKQWMAQGLKTCYFFMHQHEELHSPELIKYLIEELNKHCGTKLKAPVLLNETRKPPKNDNTLF
ncbi:MAG: DUF72 domain-containing protein [Chitinophagaceae bacterium]|nr:DUF72 domain-containing protein [Chitinophagaceae bacterium]MCB9047046.1 DUF72 domain-containing protein [Chitinophagales bacterium]